MLLYKTVLTTNTKMEFVKTKVHMGSQCAVRMERQALVRPVCPLPTWSCYLREGAVSRGQPPSHPLKLPAVRELSLNPLPAPNPFPSVCISEL